MIQFKLIAMTLVAATLFGGGFFTAKKFDQAATAEALQKAETQHMKDLQDAADIIGQEADRAEKTKIVYRTIYRKIATAGTGSACTLTPEWLRTYNEASLATTTTSKSDGAL